MSSVQFTLKMHFETFNASRTQRAVCGLGGMFLHVCQCPCYKRVMLYLKLIVMSCHVPYVCFQVFHWFSERGISILLGWFPAERAMPWAFIRGAVFIDFNGVGGGSEGGGPGGLVGLVEGVLAAGVVAMPINQFLCL